MSSNEPSLTADDTTRTLNQAIETLDLELLQTITSRESPLDLAFLHKAWQLYKNARSYRHHDHDKKNKLLITLFDHSHYPDQQRWTWAQRFLNYDLETNNAPFNKTIVSRLHPEDDVPHLTEHLIRTRFRQLCQKTNILSQLLQRLPEDHLQARCLQFMTQIQSDHQSVIQQLLHSSPPEPLLKACVCFLSAAKPDSVLAALSEDWQTVFAKTSTKILCDYNYVLKIEDKAGSLLASREENQRLPLLQTLFNKSDLSLRHLCQNEERLLPVLRLLPESQRIQLFLQDTPHYKLVSHNVPDALWPMIKPLLLPSDMDTILRLVLTQYHFDKRSIANLVNTVSPETFWQIWQRVSDCNLSTMLGKPQNLASLLHQLPPEMQERVSEQCLKHLLEQNCNKTILKPWLTDENCFMALFPVANRWLNQCVDIQDRRLSSSRLFKLASRLTAKQEWDHIPTSERQVLLRWLVNVSIQDADLLNDLLDQNRDAFHFDCLLFECWFGCTLNWNEKMPVILTILQHLSESERPRFIEQLTNWSVHSWRPKNYQAVRRAYDSFNEPVERFVKRVGLNIMIPLTPLMQAARNNDRNKAREHLSSLNEQDWLGRTALMHAVLAQKPEMVTYLAEQQGCDFSLKTLDDQTVFTFVAATGDTIAMQRLMLVSRCKPTACDAASVLFFASKHYKMVNFLFETYLPGIVWQPMESYPKSIQDRYQDKYSAWYKYYTKASLPFDLLTDQLSVLELSLNPPEIFKYQMQALQIDASKALKLDYLLPALTATGKVPPNLRLNGFQINKNELPELFGFIKSNPQLKVLSVGDMDLHREDKKAMTGMVDELDCRLDWDISSLPKTAYFFRPAVRREAEETAQASWPLRL